MPAVALILVLGLIFSSAFCAYQINRNAPWNWAIGCAAGILAGVVFAVGMR